MLTPGDHSTRRMHQESVTGDIKYRDYTKYLAVYSGHITPYHSMFYVPHQ